MEKRENYSTHQLGWFGLMVLLACVKICGQNVKKSKTLATSAKKIRKGRIRIVNRDEKKS